MQSARVLLQGSPALLHLVSHLGCCAKAFVACCIVIDRIVWFIKLIIISANIEADPTPIATFMDIKMKKLFASLIFFATSSVFALPPIPSSGTCAFLITQPVPLGITNFPFKGTGYNFMGTLTFNNASSGMMDLIVVNVTYNTQDSPYYEHSGILNNAPFTITPMSAANGFSGGFLLKVTQGSSTTAFKTTTPTTPLTNIELFANIVPVNEGKSILMQLTATKVSGGTAPGSGVCQF